MTSSIKSAVEQCNHNMYSASGLRANPLRSKFVVVTDLFHLAFYQNYSRVCCTVLHCSKFVGEPHYQRPHSVSSASTKPTAAFSNLAKLAVPQTLSLRWQQAVYAPVWRQRAR